MDGTHRSEGSFVVLQAESVFSKMSCNRPISPITKQNRNGTNLMKLIGNILWFILCGLWLGLAWAIVGLLLCLTIVLIPLGLQCFKIAQLTFFPFGKEIRFGTGAGSFLLNLVWILLFGWELALGAIIAGLLMFVTIVGIPFGFQSFKLAQLAFFPFGSTIVESRD